MKKYTRFTLRQSLLDIIAALFLAFVLTFDVDACGEQPEQVKPVMIVNGL